MSRNRRLYAIDDLCAICGYFTMDTNVNNCYGCNHPKQEEWEIDEDTKKKQGMCYQWSCPLGLHLQPASEPLDRKYFDNRGGRDSPGCGHWTNMSDDEWIWLYEPLPKKRGG